MAKHIRSLRFHILKRFFPCLLLVSFHFPWFPIGWHLHFSLRIRIAKNTPKSHITIHIMKVLSGLLCVFMMWRANLSSTIHIMNALSSLLSAFMKKIAGLCRHHECGMLNLECTQPFTIHIHDGCSNFEWIRYFVLKKFKHLQQLKKKFNNFFNSWRLVS